MNDRSVSLCTDTSALHEYLCTHYTDTERKKKFCKLLNKRPQTVVFSNYVGKVNVKNLGNCEKVYCMQVLCVSAYTDTE